MSMANTGKNTTTGEYLSSSILVTACALGVQFQNGTVCSTGLLQLASEEVFLCFAGSNKAKTVAVYEDFCGTGAGVVV